jgi:Zn-finger nucleic acid-binding protein
MDEVSKTGILIDVCPKCKGVWLDRGELNQLLDRVRQYETEYDSFNEKRYFEPNYNQYDKHHHQYDKHHHKQTHHKKKGLFKVLGDIFD